MFAEFTIAVCVSWLITVLIIRFEHLHSHVSGDHDTGGPQKFHIHPIPRIGGVPIFAGLSAGLAWAAMRYPAHAEMIGYFAIASLPVFLAGMAEDLTKRIGPRTRLFAAFLSALVGGWLLSGVLYRLDLPVIDSLLLTVPLLAWLLTMVAVGGVAHSFNIIDGYNGLSSVVALLALGALAYVSYLAGDRLLVAISIAMIGGILGFLVWNYPQGMIFAGDGGAYLMGFVVAEVSVMLVVRNPQVSPWFPLLLSIYPVWETLFSAYRRRFVSGRPTGLPDALHLHQMIYRRLVRWMVGSREAHHLLKRNSMTAPYLWTVAALCTLPAALFWAHTTALQIASVAFIIGYVWLYRRLVRFRSPRWLIRRAPVIPIAEPDLRAQPVRQAKRRRA